MLVLKRHYQFWFSILGLHKLGAVVIPATNLLKEHDFEYRFNAAERLGYNLCRRTETLPHEIDRACERCPGVRDKGSCRRSREMAGTISTASTSSSPESYERTEDSPCGDDPMLMFFTSGTTGYPKIAEHSLQIPARPLRHREILALRRALASSTSRSPIPAGARRSGASSTVSGCARAAVFTYDFDRFHARGYPAPLQEIQHHDLLRAAHDVPHDDQGGSLEVRSLFGPARRRPREKRLTPRCSSQFQRR